MIWIEMSSKDYCDSSPSSMFHVWTLSAWETVFVYLPIKDHNNRKWQSVESIFVKEFLDPPHKAIGIRNWKTGSVSTGPLLLIYIIYIKLTSFSGYSSWGKECRDFSEIEQTGSTFPGTQVGLRSYGRGQWNVALLVTTVFGMWEIRFVNKTATKTPQVLRFLLRSKI